MNQFAKDLRKVPVIRVLLPFSAGIVFADHLPGPSISGWWFLLMLGFLAFRMTLNRLRFFQSVGNSYIFSTLLIMIFFYSGIQYSNSFRTVNTVNCNNTPAVVGGFLLTDPERGESSLLISMKADQWMVGDSLFSNAQNVRIYLQGKPGNLEMRAGEYWIFAGTIRRIRNQGNPEEFDYAAYMARRNYWFTLFVKNDGFCEKVESSKIPLAYQPARVAEKIRSGWDMHDPDAAVLSAITLGDKRLITRETKSAYAGSGAMHLLAVSGLHVGMIWWVLDLVIRIPQRKRIFRVMKVCIVMGILWFYAGITGFSDSVCRSVTMFSLVSVARSLNRRSNIYNTLLLSAFILLALRPSRITEPGFQLSYIAVFGIVTLHPLLISRITVRHRMLRRVVDLIFVSIAAQISTLPLSLLYFHQFPVYFLLTNLVAIPLVSILLALFVVFSPCFLLNFYSGFFSMILLKITHLLNQCIHVISTLPGAVRMEVPMEQDQAVVLLLFIFSGSLFFVYKRAVWLIVPGVLFSLLIILSAKHTVKLQSQEMLTVFHQSECTAISFNDRCNRVTFIFYEEIPPGPYVYDYLRSLQMTSNRQCSHRIVELSSKDTLQDSGLHLVWMGEGAWIGEFAGARFLVCGKSESSIVMNILKNFNPDLVVLRKGAPFLKDEMVALLQGKTIVADGTLQSWELSRLKERIPGLYMTGIHGAYTYHDFNTLNVSP